MRSFTWRWKDTPISENTVYKYIAQEKFYFPDIVALSNLFDEFSWNATSLNSVLLYSLIDLAKYFAFVSIYEIRLIRWL